MGIAASLLLLIVGAVAGRATLHTEGSGDVLRDLHRRLNDLEVQLAVSRIDQPTAAERLKAAAVDVALPYRDARIVESLLDALEADPSPNVRMAVITTLYNIEDTARLRERFDTLLAAQALPMLQIALIELAADRRLVESVGALRRMATEPGDDAVRQRARWAISVLSPGA
jgi:rRNA-processing protein FCF1